MKHICTVDFEGHIFGIAVDKSIDNPGMYRLICDDDSYYENPEIEDAFETEEEAICSIHLIYPNSPIEWEY